MVRRRDASKLDAQRRGASPRLRHVPAFDAAQQVHARANVAARRAAATFEKGKHGGDTMKVTWARLDELDSDLSARVWALARRYGYDREPPARPS